MEWLCKIHVHNWYYFKRSFKTDSPLTKYGATVQDRICVRCSKIEADYDGKLRKYNQELYITLALLRKLKQAMPIAEYGDNFEFNLIWKIFKEPYIQ